MWFKWQESRGVGQLSTAKPIMQIDEEFMAINNTTFTNMCNQQEKASQIKMYMPKYIFEKHSTYVQLYIWN